MLGWMCAWVHAGMQEEELEKWEMEGAKRRVEVRQWRREERG